LAARGLPTDLAADDPVFAAALLRDLETDDAALDRAEDAHLDAELDQDLDHESDLENAGADGLPPPPGEVPASSPAVRATTSSSSLPSLLNPSPTFNATAPQSASSQHDNSADHPSAPPGEVPTSSPAERATTFSSLQPSLLDPPPTFDAPAFDTSDHLSPLLLSADTS
jgi:hypothetical protein